MTRNLINNLKKLAVVACVSNSKLPATKHGLNDARCNADVEGLINNGYNIGVNCARSGLIAFDIDYHNPDSNAEGELKALENDLGQLPKTLTQTTASGKGKHLIFSAKGVNSPKGKLSKNIDIRYNAYIMFAPSIINGCQYEIIDGIDDNGDFVIATLPDPWLNYINKDCARKRKRSSKKTSYTVHKPHYSVNIDEMFYLCNFLHHCRINATTLSEPEWFSMVSILAPIDGCDEVIHELSRPYSGYSYEETQKKIDNAKRFGQGHSCAYIASCFPEVCANCPIRRGGM